MEINIRRAVQGDCARIRPLQQEIADLHFQGRPDLFRTQARFFTEENFAKRICDPDHTIFIAETPEGVVVGYAFAWVEKYRNHSTYVDFDRYYIDDICVLGAFRKNGIGHRLFDCCKADAQQRKCRTIDLGVWSFNSDAIAFYRSCGMDERVLRMEYRLEE